MGNRLPPIVGNWYTHRDKGAMFQVVALDEDAARGPARERLEPHRARAGEEVEHARALDRADERERGLAHTVAGRSRDDALRRGDPVPLARAGDDPHG